MMTDQNILDKSMRSVFVGNIPYEATEEKLKDIFNEVGPVISFKLVYDRETGKPKGYGFCEYKDQETALSAMRNLNGYEIGGRTLRVDNACTEKSRLEMQSLMLGMPTSESYYGDSVKADKAPEIINNVISTLPPEQLFDLMKQMKECVQNNPVEARNMLLQNPQLGYALLQAQVVMKIIEPEVAKTMLHPAHKVPSAIPVPYLATRMPPPNNQWTNSNPPITQIHPPTSMINNIDWLMNDFGRNIGSDVRHPTNQILFSLPPQQAQSFSGLRDSSRSFIVPNNNQQFGDRNTKSNSFMTLPPMSVPPPRIPEQLMPSPRVLQNQFQSQLQSSQAVTSDNEKASLIMQVLQLTDVQIALLPVDQRHSIIQLKEKISYQKKE